MRLKAIVLFTVVLTLLLTSFAFAKDDNNRTRGPVRLAKTSDFMNVIESVLNINTITTFSDTKGFFDAVIAGSWNGEYPKGSGVGVIFREGIVWAAKVNDGGVLVVRAGGSSQTNGLQGGGEIGYVADPYNAPTGFEDEATTQVWRVRTDYFTANLTGDAASFNIKGIGSVTDEDTDNMLAQYAHDWDHWPSDQGAPYADLNGDDVYTPGVDTDDDGLINPDGSEGDIPGFPGASQTMWYVSNDLDDDVSALLAGAPAIGIEMQMTLFSFDFPSTNPLGNISFKRVRLIYTGTVGGPSDARIDTMYVTQWSDPDLGDFGDDFVGTDLDLSLGFVYNGNTRDSEYFGKLGIPVPAAGYDFLQGPIDAAGDTLGMTSFTFFGAGSGVGDPDRGIYTGTLQWFNLMEGFLPRPEYPEQVPLLSPIDNLATNFWLSGDPVDQSGWVDGLFLPPGDRRMLVTTGPFEMALGDTQDIVVAFVGGIGLDNISSVTVMKFHDKFAQFAFDEKFDLPSPPTGPAVTASEFDGNIILSWGQDAGSIAATEDAVNAGFAFEGYNIYQFPTSGSSLSEAQRIATFDIRNAVSTIFDDGVDPISGFVISTAKQFGTNTGIQRFISITKDAIRGRPLSNGIEYFFGVTAYSFLSDNAGKPFKQLESSPILISVTPQTPLPGTEYDVAFGDTIQVAHPAGVSDGIVQAIVIDPTKTNGHNYEVTFAEDTDTESATFGEILWTLVDKTTGTTLLTDQLQSPDIISDLTELIIDGLHIQVQGPPFDFAGAGDGIIEVAYAGTALTPDQWDAAGTPFGGNKVWHSGNSNGDYYVASGGGSGNLARLKRYIEFAVPRDFEIRFTDAGGFGVYVFEDDMVATVPFELWDIGIATVDDPSDDIRMIPFLLGNDGTGAAWGWATGADPAFGFPASDWVYWMDPEGTDGYDNFAAYVVAGGGAGSIYDFAGDPSTDGYFANFHGGFVYPIGRSTYTDLAGDGTPPPTGTVIRFLTTKTVGTDDVFTFKAPSVTTGDADLAAADIENINVFPNPYYGFHEVEPSRYDKFVTFSHLPKKATIRIFNLGGQMVRLLNKDDDTQFIQWNMENQNRFPVASGIYIIHIDMEDFGSKILKLALVQEEQVLRNY